MCKIICFPSSNLILNTIKFNGSNNKIKMEGFQELQNTVLCKDNNVRVRAVSNIEFVPYKPLIQVK